MVNKEETSHADELVGILLTNLWNILKFVCGITNNLNFVQHAKAITKRVFFTN